MVDRDLEDQVINFYDVRRRLGFAVLGASAISALTGLLLAAPAAATPTPSPGAATVNQAGTSFLTATAVHAGQPVHTPAFTGDYLYWSFTATPGQVTEISLSVTLPPADQRTGASTWAVEVFDGLRRRQACTAGAQTPTATADAAEVVLGCTLRRVRSWAEPWSGDPLPGIYYIRLSVVDLPEEDLGLPIEVDMLIGTIDGGTSEDDGDLKAPLMPPAKPGKVVTAADPTASDGPSPSPEAEVAASWATDWLPEFSARWVWTTIGGVLAAIAGVVGFSLTWRRRT
ncbi:MAG TPA: peptidase [Micromonosporaceae bacterium]